MDQATKDYIDQKFTDLSKKIDRQFEELVAMIQREFRQVHERLVMIENRLAMLEHRVAVLEEEMREVRDAIGMPTRRPASG